MFSPQHSRLRRILSAHYPSATMHDEIELGDAVRPSPGPRRHLQRGYCFMDLAPDEDGHVIGCRISESCPSIFQLFMELLHTVGGFDPDVFVWLIRDDQDGQPQVINCDCHELVILQSMLWEFEELLTNDGMLAIKVLGFGDKGEAKVVLDEHKVIYLSASDPLSFRPFISVLCDNDLEEVPELTSIVDVQHDHCSNEHLAQQFEKLCDELGANY